VRLRLVLAKAGIGKTVPVIKDAAAEDFQEAGRTMNENITEQTLRILKF
jgi:hypothetical protein